MQLSRLSVMNDFVLARVDCHTTRSVPSHVRFLLPLTNKAWISQRARHSFHPVFPGVLKGL